MDANEWQLVSIIVLLVGAVYAGVLFEQRRNAKNTHRLRHVVQKIIITLATHGIVVRTDDDERG